MFGYKKYTVFFEAFGRKMKTEVVASSEERAKEIVKEKIVFHKVTAEKTNGDEVDQIFQKLMEILK
jgi:hypothetical protein